ncbi:MAG: 7-carboxy-7-deazaguanine synthase [Sphingomonadales bacterium]|uniref:7-carboxy-7-deazaguanine synthase n=1 Tax=Sphingorhabdus sp. TaxID=1902408 RepID=UPI003BAFFA27|nr:7-carboxy-7-deazaguanine synthase [Sphingomonadales bacterium]
MNYAVKEIFLTLQGEGVHSGRRAVFLRFAGCNLWTGREEDRAHAVCQFCDTDFVGMDGENGGRYEADELAANVARLWGETRDHRYVVLTGGEPMLQVDDAIIDALHAQGFTIAIESNGTIAAHSGIDWVCISPKAGSDVIQHSGDELKLVWPQNRLDPLAMESWQFDHFLIQPMDRGSVESNQQCREEAIAFVSANPKWRLSLQNHKLLGLP